MAFNEIFLESHIVSNFDQKCLEFGQKKRSSFPTLHSKSIEERFDDNFCKKGIIFHLFSDFNQIVFWLSRWSLCKSGQISFALLFEDFMQSKCFLKEFSFHVFYVLDQLTSEMFVKSSCQNCQNCCKRVKKTIMSVFFKKLLVPSAETFLTFPKNSVCQIRIVPP